MRGGPVRRTRDVRVRLTPEEWARWDRARQASGRRELGAWVRATVEELLTGQPHPRRPGDLPRTVVPEINAAAYRHLTGAANNTNQLARWCHRAGRAPDAEALAHLVDHLQATARYLVRGGPPPAEVVDEHQDQEDEPAPRTPERPRWRRLRKPRPPR